ncbi:MULTISPECIES: winged helix-turn-helix domain-containing protein [unclassified Sporolactobacillus]|uniref:winged helix-turn-helix domain-containing protein n=1 Tax=unclassified Sporolactobacillus TaxID=2628533 RepID=UPI002367BC81|nr:helix-turn-helix domain-containing protein [Sporolactobacillus sp. CQH2019]MDD9149812.1 helix-turn-helix domain-containing protein [Sporolactobacillus sp. CQH2019]
MMKNVISQLAKLMADEKIIAILKATKDKKGLTSKEISKKVNIPTNQLYYSVKKMVDEGLLEVTQKKNIKNFQEFYYSSYKMTHHSSKTLSDTIDGIEDGVNISAKWVEQHSKEVAQWILYETQQFLESMQADIKEYGSDPQQEVNIHAGAFSSSPKLSREAETKLLEDILLLIENAPKNDQGKDKKTINLLVEKWSQK